ncbi:MAG: PilZ domain-containing protein [Candidatus Omnitrophica bacterium]|nr:PilZ domain-containing protein [Candidatus Omnitrophota bacterium]
MWEGINKRRFPRAQYPCKITVIAKFPPYSVSTHTENISVGGICVNLERNLGRFTPVEVILHLPDEQPPLRCNSTTVWVIEKHLPQEKHIFDTGIEFGDIAPEDRERIDEVIVNLLREGKSA